MTPQMLPTSFEHTFRPQTPEVQARPGQHCASVAHVPVSGAQDGATQAPDVQARPAQQSVFVAHAALSDPQSGAAHAPAVQDKPAQQSALDAQAPLSASQVPSLPQWRVWPGPGTPHSSKVEKKSSIPTTPHDGRSTSAGTSTSRVSAANLVMPAGA